MNYLEQVLGFWDQKHEKDLYPLDVAIYFSILEISNKLAWQNPFIFHWEMVRGMTGASKNAIYKSIYRLEKAKFIEYEVGNPNRAGKITILQLTTKRGLSEEQARTKRGLSVDYAGNLNKPINYKPKTIDEVKDYFKSNGYREDIAERAYGYYEELGWHDRNGKPIKNWKNQMRNNWFKPEYKLSWEDVPWKETMKMSDEDFVKFMETVPDKEWFSAQRVRYGKLQGA